MGRKCVYPDCETTSGGLHRCPKDPDVKRRWIQALGLRKLHKGRSTFYVCENHFSRDSFSNSMEVSMGYAKKRHLKGDAIPVPAAPATYYYYTGPVPLNTPQTLSREAMPQHAVTPEGQQRLLLPKHTREIGCQTDPILTKHAFVQADVKPHRRSKAIQARFLNRSVYCDTSSLHVPDEPVNHIPIKRPRCGVSNYSSTVSADCAAFRPDVASITVNNERCEFETRGTTRCEFETRGQQGVCGGEEELCAVCRGPGGAQLSSCCRCLGAFHRACHVPALSQAPSGEWLCSLCRALPPPAADVSVKQEPGAEELKAGDQMRCERLLLGLYCNQLSTDFQKPDCPLDSHRYKELIETPMDLSTVKRRLESNSASVERYVTPEEFVSDVRLIFLNCLKYYRETSEVANAGMSLGNHFEEQLMVLYPGRTFPEPWEQQPPVALLQGDIKQDGDT